jgi:hypothetical protein
MRAWVTLGVGPSGQVLIRSLDEALDASLLGRELRRDGGGAPGSSRGPPPAARAELLHVLRLPDFDRADAIGSYWGHPETRSFAEPLIDCEEDRTLQAVLVGMLREMERGDR